MGGRGILMVVFMFPPKIYLLLIDAPSISGKHPSQYSWFSFIVLLSSLVITLSYFIRKFGVSPHQNDSFGLFSFSWWCTTLMIVRRKASGSSYLLCFPFFLSSPSFVLIKDCSFSNVINHDKLKHLQINIPPKDRKNFVAWCPTWIFLVIPFNIGNMLKWKWYFVFSQSSKQQTDNLNYCAINWACAVISIVGILDRIVSGHKVCTLERKRKQIVLECDEWISMLDDLAFGFVKTADLS